MCGYVYIHCHPLPSTCPGAENTRPLGIEILFFFFVLSPLLRMGISECFLMRHALPFRIISGKLLGSYCHQTGCLSVFLSLPLASSLSPSLVSQWLVSFDFVLLNSPADPPLCALSSWVKGNGGALQPLCEHLVPVSCVPCTLLPPPPLSSSPWGVLMPSMVRPYSSSANGT